MIERGNPKRCAEGDDACNCSRCSYACGYEDARDESMGAVLASIDMARQLHAPRRIPSRRVLNQYADMLEKVAVEEYGDRWAPFVAEVRRRRQAELN